MDAPLPPPIEVDVLSDLCAQLPATRLAMLHFDSAFRTCADIEAMAPHWLLRGEFFFSVSNAPIYYPAEMRIEIGRTRDQMLIAVLMSIGAALALRDPLAQVCTVRVSRIECTGRIEGALGWRWCYAVTIDRAE